MRWPFDRRYQCPEYSRCSVQIAGLHSAGYISNIARDFLCEIVSIDDFEGIGENAVVRISTGLGVGCEIIGIGAKNKTRHRAVV